MQDYFWTHARKTPVYDKIRAEQENYTDEERARMDARAELIRKKHEEEILRKQSAEYNGFQNGYVVVIYGDTYSVKDELKEAGAEAISINDERIINMTDIVSVNENTVIRVNQQRVVSPYVIKAIGSQTQLINTLSIKETGFIDYRTSQGKTVKLEKQRNIKIPKYTGEIEVRYMKEVED